MLTLKQLFDFASPSCRVRVEAIKIARRDGLAIALAYLDRNGGNTITVREYINGREEEINEMIKEGTLR